MVLVFSIPWLCILKYGHKMVNESGNFERSNATTIKHFSVDSCDLKFRSYEFGNDIFITFEIPRVAYNRPVRRINISLQFRPSVIRGPCLLLVSLFFIWGRQKFPARLRLHQFEAMMGAKKFWSINFCSLQSIEQFTLLSIIIRIVWLIC